MGRKKRSKANRKDGLDAKLDLLKTKSLEPVCWRAAETLRYELSKGHQAVVIAQLETTRTRMQRRTHNQTIEVCVRVIAVCNPADTDKPLAQIVSVTMKQTFTRHYKAFGWEAGSSSFEYDHQPEIPAGIAWAAEIARTSGVSYVPGSRFERGGPKYERVKA